jgi:hypothetical protein
MTQLPNYHIDTEPYYRPIGNEIALFEAAYADRLPMMLKGPTGCGKTRFIEHMAVEAGKTIDHGCLSRGHDGLRPCRTVSSRCLRNGLARRAADPCGPAGRDLLSG